MRSLKIFSRKALLQKTCWVLLNFSNYQFCLYYSVKNLANCSQLISSQFWLTSVEAGLKLLKTIVAERTLGPYFKLTPSKQINVKATLKLR